MSWFRRDDPARTAVPSATVGLLVGLNPPPHWGDAVRSLAGYAEVCVATPGVATPGVATPGLATPGGNIGDSIGDRKVDAWLASSSGVPLLARARATGRPVVVLPPAPPTTGPDVRSIPPATPFVRSRWRRRFGLPEDMVVTAAELPDDLRPTALAVAAAVVATGPELLLEALAWGAPTVTDPESADAAGAQPDVEVLIGGLDEAHALAADIRRAAALGRAGRRFVERLHDPVQAAADLRRALGLVARPSPVDHVFADALADAVADALDDLWTPADARIRGRAADLVGRAR